MRCNQTPENGHLLRSTLAATRESVSTERLGRRLLDIMAVAGFVVAAANGVAFGLVLHARWFWGFFSSWEVPVFFMSFSIVLGAACWWISDRVSGLYQIVAIAGIAICVVTSIAVVVLAIMALLLVVARFVFENADMRPKKSYSQRYRKRPRRGRY